MQQVLALVSLPGLSHVERNGHYHVAGMQGTRQAEKARFAAAHPNSTSRAPTARCCRSAMAGLVSLARGGQLRQRHLARFGAMTPLSSRGQVQQQPVRRAKRVLNCSICPANVPSS